MATNYFEMMKDVVGSYGDGVGLARDRQYQNEKRAREKVIQGREDKTYNDAQAQLAEENAAVQQYGLLTTKGKANEAAITANRTANQAGLDGAIEQIGLGQPVVPPTYTPAQPEYTPATDLDKNRGLQGISRARRDWNGVASLQKEEKGLKWDEGYGAKLKEYKGTPEQIAEGTAHVNATSKVLTFGKPGKDGVASFSITVPGRDAVFGQLSRQDQAKLWAAGGMMDTDPTRALEVMAGVNKELAAAIAADNGLAGVYAGILDKQAGRDETRRHNRASEGNAAAGLQLRREEGKLARRAPVNFIDAEGKLVMVDTNALPIKDGVYQTPPGLRQLKQPESLNDREKLAYTAAMKEIADMPQGGDVAGVYTKYGLNPETLGVNDPVAALAKAILAKQGNPAPAAKPAPTGGIRMPVPPQQQAYDAYQASRPGWFSQPTPTSAAREREAEQVYLESLRNNTR